MAFFEDRSGANKVEELLRKAAETRRFLLLSVINMATTKLAASLKAEHKLPYVDCFAVALAQQRKATLVTTDKGFAQVDKQVNLLWANKI